VVEKKDSTHSQGPAFLAMDHGLAVTAQHVVEGAKRVVAKFAIENTVCFPVLLPDPPV